MNTHAQAILEILKAAAADAAVIAADAVITSVPNAGGLIAIASVTAKAMVDLRARLMAIRSENEEAYIAACRLIGKDHVALAEYWLNEGSGDGGDTSDRT